MRSSEDPHCPYCGRKAYFGNGTSVYGPGFAHLDLWICPQKSCEAWVGVVRGTRKPRGTLGNVAMRAARKSVLDKMDRLRKDFGFSRQKIRRAVASAMENWDEQDWPIGFCEIEELQEISGILDEFLASASQGAKTLPIVGREKRLRSQAEDRLALRVERIMYNVQGMLE